MRGGEGDRYQERIILNSKMGRYNDDWTHQAKGKNVLASVHVLMVWHTVSTNVNTKLCIIVYTFLPEFHLKFRLIRCGDLVGRLHDDAYIYIVYSSSAICNLTVSDKLLLRHKIWSVKLSNLFQLIVSKEDSFYTFLITRLISMIMNHLECCCYGATEIWKILPSTSLITLSVDSSSFKIWFHSESNVD